jgi:ferric-dicitrate binding protein FerR (iron transport regulator)
MTRAERMGELMFKHARKGISRKEERKLSNWRKLSPEYEKVYQHSTDTGRILRDLARMLDSEERILEKIQEKNPAAAYEIRKKPPVVVRMLKYAAILILIIATLFILNPGKGSKELQAIFVSPDGVKMALDDFHRGFLAGSAGISFDKDEKGNLEYIAKNFPRASKDKSFKLYTAEGGHFRIKLPDSISIWLNQNTTLQYPANFSLDSTRISVIGETYFETGKDTSKALLIIIPPTANSQRPTKLQIASSESFFNIKAYPDSVMEITVVKGKLNLSIDSAGSKSLKTVQLLPGQQAYLAGGKLTILETVDVDKVTSWKDW